jgi:hypothetical protein
MKAINTFGKRSYTCFVVIEYKGWRISVAPVLVPVVGPGAMTAVVRPMWLFVAELMAACAWQASANLAMS